MHIINMMNNIIIYYEELNVVTLKNMRLGTTSLPPALFQKLICTVNETYHQIPQLLSFLMTTCVCH